MRIGPSVLLISIGTLAGTPSTAQQPDSALLAGLEWRPVGPANMSGRVTDVEGVPGTGTFYVAAATGGIWRTTNHGTTFRPVFDDQRVISMGDLAIAPSDPDVLYAGTGEEDSRNSISPGGGVYRSTDGGETWTLTGLVGTQVIGRIVVHPRNPDIAYVAALGAIWGANRDRGLYKTLDGGRSWRKVKHVSDRAGFVDVALDPRNPEVVWAASWERVRGPWFLESGGPGSALWRSVDGGASWTEVKGGGWPSTEKGRIGLAIAPSSPDVMYAMVEAEPGDTSGLPGAAAPSSGLKGSGLYRSEDGGRSWRWMNGNNVRPFYYSQVRVAPDNPYLIHWSSTPVNFSRDGGETIGTATHDLHVDHHAMWWDPANPERFIVGNDGGIAVTWDRGGTYDFINTLPLGQFYHVSYDMGIPYRVCGGLQDNGTWCGPSRRADDEGFGDHVWYTINGGDGFYTQQDPTDSRIVYAESQGGNMARIDMATGRRTALGRPDWRERARPLLDSIAVLEGVEEPRTMTAAERAKVAAWKRRVSDDSARHDLRYNWSTPLVLSPHDPRTLYAAGNRVLKSTNRGDTLEVISPDLSNGDTMKVRVSTRTTGGITRDATGAETHGTVVALAESPVRKGLLFAGTDDGNVWTSGDDGGSWERIDHARFQGVPAGTWVSRIEPSRVDPRRFYVSFDGHRSNDFTPYVFVTDDGGRSFRSIAAGLPTGGPDFVHVIREDPVNPDLLYVGTDVGAYASMDRGRSWFRFMNGLPTVPVHDLQVHPRDRELIAGTHGRSIWIVDVVPLQELGRRTLAAAEPTLFRPKPALQYGDAPSGGENTGHRFFWGKSPDYGAEIAYFIPAAAEAAVAADESGSAQGGPAAAGERRGRQVGAGRTQAAIAILDPAGDTVATLEGPARAGVQRVYWDLQERAAPPKPKTPSELRDSIAAARAIRVIADSLITVAGKDSATVERAVQAVVSGDRSLFRRGGGGGVADPDRPGERYPGPTAGRPAGAEPAADAPGGPRMEDVADVARDISRAARERNIPGFSFRRFFGGGPNDVEPGEYTVALTIGGRTYTQPLTVIRSETFRPAETPDPEEVRLFLKSLRR
ncbi:MAG TPA: hypothetical protein VMM12_01840 [Longimicrobiales bacterium]|nr:hypothetical protein [Longimicrobiales bacterium]